MGTRTPLTLKTQRTLVGRIIENMPDDLPEETAQHWNRYTGELGAGLRELLLRPADTSSWVDKIVAAENKSHRAFFGQTFDLSPFRAVLEKYGEERVRVWAGLGLEPHYLPKCLFQPDSKFRGWKIKPNNWFWGQVTAGNIKRRNATGGLETVTEVGFDEISVLIDTRGKPEYDGGSQMFDDDETFLGGLIKNLRSNDKIAHYDYGPQQGSRFGVSSLEWDSGTRPALESRQEFAGVSWRLELAIEANTIPQIYKRLPRRKDGQTNTLVWYEEFFGALAGRLGGGCAYSGGLASVHWHGSDSHWRRRASSSGSSGTLSTWCLGTFLGPLAPLHWAEVYLKMNFRPLCF